MGCVQEKDKNKNTPQSALLRPFKRQYSHEIILSNENIYKLYRFDKLIGSGKFGIVKMAYLRRDPSKIVAIKSISKSTLKDNVNMLKRELSILRTLDHPNVARFYETYEDERYVHFVMEYCAGGDIIDAIIAKKTHNEQEAQKVMHTLFSVVSYLHFKGIVHRDIKPQNILQSSLDDNYQIKLIDFGLSKKYRSDKNAMNTKVGTPLYVAPEVLDGKYSFECDNWSLGVILYVLLCGNPPFFSENSSDVYTLIKQGLVTFHEKEWESVSIEAKNLISSLLQVDPTKRLKSNEALKHQWFNKLEELHFEQTQNINNREHQVRVINQLKKYTQYKLLKKEALKIFLTQLKDKDLQNLLFQFREFDIEQNGIISYKEMLTIMHSLGYTQTEQEVASFMAQFQNAFDVKDVDNLCINYSEFIAATLDHKLYSDQEILWNMFQYFDTDSSGEITIENMRDVMTRLGRKITRKEIQQILTVGNRRDNKINFQEFCALMKDDEDKSDLLHNLEIKQKQQKLSA